MAQIPDRILAWLYNVLQDYNDPQRAYTDAAQLLRSFPSLSPRTEVHTFDNGSSALLLTLSGTLPTSFRGTTYQFPIKVWLPRSYPQEPPFLYVIPSKEMQIRPGQHVAVDGRLYHPYLRDWPTMWDRASVVELLGYFQQAFAKEPPVTNRTEQRLNVGTRSFSEVAGPPRPPPKQQEVTGHAVEMPQTSTPPPRPPKPGEQQALPAPQQRDYSRDGPPLPPLPGQRLQDAHRTMSSPAPSYHRVQHPDMPPRFNYNGQPAAAYSQAPLQHVGRPLSQHQVSYERSPVSPITQTSELNGSAGISRRPGQQQYPVQHPSQISLPSAFNQRPQAISTPQQRSAAHDLLSDPFEVTLPTSRSIQVAAPPIPPNPERIHLLQALSTSLVQQAQQKIQQNQSALAPLHAQHHALRTAYSRLENELAQNQLLDAQLASNESILRHSIQECDHAIGVAKTKKQPPIDDVLVAPTLVAQQLWSICAEEAACREAMYALQTAVDKGRVNGSDFVRQMRGLGRERFLKMALARKCARGLGLEIDGR